MTGTEWPSEIDVACDTLATTSNNPVINSNGKPTEND